MTDNLDTAIHELGHACAYALAGARDCAILNRVDGPGAGCVAVVSAPHNDAEIAVAGPAFAVALASDFEGIDFADKLILGGRGIVALMDRFGFDAEDRATIGDSDVHAVGRKYTLIAQWQKARWMQLAAEVAETLDRGEVHHLPLRPIRELLATNPVLVEIAAFPERLWRDDAQRESMTTTALLGAS